MNDCVFCGIVAGEVPCEKVFDEEDFIVIKDANPKVVGHLLVISKKHFDNFLDLSSEIYESLLVSVRRVLDDLKIENFNLVLNNGKLAGQIVSHLHFHILPRRERDGFSLNV